MSFLFLTSRMPCCWPALFEHLFSNGVTLVTTSNIPPDRCTRVAATGKVSAGHQLIKQHTQVIELSGNTDYRLRILEQSEIFHYPLDEAADRVMTAELQSHGGRMRTEP